MRNRPLFSRPQFLSVALLGAVLMTTALTYRVPRALAERGESEGGPEQTEEAAPAARVEVCDSLHGHSGRLTATIGLVGEPLEGLSAGAEDGLRWQGIDGDSTLAVRIAPGGLLLAPEASGAWILEQRWERESPHVAGVRRVRVDADEGGEWRAVMEAPRVLVLEPREHKRGGLLNGYRIGTYRARPPSYSEAYEPPSGFVAVTEETRRLPLSEHFTLGEFITKDQDEIWPKYIALDMRLIDSLELVIDELRDMGHEANGLFIMSGYRTPHYNGNRSRFSRHVYGDAADVWVDESGDGRMDDLNGDGRSDIQDGRVLAEAADRVQTRYPDLLGGVGVYGPREPRGPFVHIDVRGHRARW